MTGGPGKVVWPGLRRGLVAPCLPSLKLSALSFRWGRSMRLPLAHHPDCILALFPGDGTPFGQGPADRYWIVTVPSVVVAGISPPLLLPSVVIEIFSGVELPEPPTAVTAR